MKYLGILILLLFYRLIWSSPISSANTTAEERKIFNINGLNVTGQNISLSGEKNFQATQQLFYFFGNDDATRGANKQIARKNLTLPDGYIVSPGIGAHKLHLEDVKNWNDARKVCIQEGGHLVVVLSEQEESIIQNMRRQHNLRYAYIGLHDLFAEGDWVSVLDQPLNKIGLPRWSNLLPNLPDNLGGTQHCAGLMEGGMDDVVCTDAIPFICKINID